jgi:hypothetical protein
LRAIIINPQNNLQMRGEKDRQTACTRESTCVGRPAQQSRDSRDDLWGGQHVRPVGRPAQPVRTRSTPRFQSRTLRICKEKTVCYWAISTTDVAMSLSSTALDFNHGHRVRYQALPVAIKYSPYLGRRDGFVRYLISFDIGLLGYRIERN